MGPLMEPGASPGNRLVARRAREAFGGTNVEYERHWDAEERSHVDVVRCSDSPCSGVSSFATIGLSDYRLRKEGKELRLAVELVGACDARLDGFGSALATSAFCVINSGWFCAPGVIFPDVIRTHGLSRTMQDIYFLSPFLWGDGPPTLEVEDFVVEWLLAVPISRQEANFAGAHGDVPANVEEG